MSLEDTIALAANEVGQARDEILGLVGVANTQITRVGDAYDARIASLTVSFYVDPITGNDANEGTDVSPLKSIHAALSATPRGGKCIVNLQNTYEFSDPILGDPTSGSCLINGVDLEIHNVGSMKSINFSRQIDFNTNTRLLHGFNFLGRSSLSIVGANIVLPDTSVGTNSAPQNHQSCPMALIGTSDTNLIQINLAFCKITGPASQADQWGNLIGSAGSPVALKIAAMSYSGLTSMNGRWLDAHTNTAGTSVASLPNVLSNISTI